jgi:hypothetical protein
MPLKGSYLSISRQLDELERRAETVRWGAGCPLCVAWPAYPLDLAPEVAQYDRSRDCLGGTAAAPCPGCPDCRPRGGWPPSFKCPGCHREPAAVIAVRYAEPPPGGTVVHLADEAPRPEDAPADAPADAP